MTLITLGRRLGKTEEAPGGIINGSPQQPRAQHPPTAKEQPRDPGTVGWRVKWGHGLASASR